MFVMYKHLSIGGKGMDNVRSHADTRLCGNTCLKRQINMPRKKFSVGAWVKVPTEKTVTGVDFIIGKIIDRTPYFFVVKSEAGGFSVAYTWRFIFDSLRVFLKRWRDILICLLL